MRGPGGVVKDFPHVYYLETEYFMVDKKMMLVVSQIIINNNLSFKICYVGSS